VTTRRHVLLTLSAVACWPSLVRAQSKPPIVIGWLSSESRTEAGFGIVAFKEGMAALAWKEGLNYTIEERWADGSLERLPLLAQELAARKPAIIVAALSRAAQAAAKASPHIPIVQANGGSPDRNGLAKSLARPGGMVTGLTNVADEVWEKYLELLLGIAPGVRRVGFLSDATTSLRDARVAKIRESIKRYSIEVGFAEVARAHELDAAIARLVKQGVQALVLLPSSWWNAERARIVKLALSGRLALIAGSEEWAEAGALLAYGADRPALYKRAAYFVDRIVKGAKPGDLPIERPTKFELVINLKTAQELGITVPQSMLLRADKVIE
jgi:putative tryptophan/tyrosine transport system substrate-binding protein